MELKDLDDEEDLCKAKWEQRGFILRSYQSKNARLFG